MANKTYFSEHYEEFKMKGDKNIFEEIIDSMISSEICGMNDTFKTAISVLPRKDKRLAILSLLDKDRNLFSRIKALTNSSINRMDHIKDVILMLREYVKVGEVEKKKFGEVMTPLELVKEMLATLPEEVWSNPNLKWLDPANGTGPYPVMVIYKLMNGLKEWEPDDEKRYKHIVENMIYVCELQPKNMFLYMCAVDPFDVYKLNVYTGSFLDEGFDKHMEDVWSIDKFDICVGNPPYQEQKIGNKKTQPLWHLFVRRAIDFLQESGFLCIVHPGGWRNVDGVFKQTQILLKSKQILFISINNFEQGKKIFGANTNFDYYCLKNINNNQPTKIKTSNSEVEYVSLNNVEFIPDININKIYNLISNDFENRITLINNSSYHHQRQFMSKLQNDEFKYPCVYMVKTTGEPILWYSNRNDRGHFGIFKVIFASGAGSGIFVDVNGEYATTEFASAILDNDVETLQKIKIALSSDKFLKLMGKTGSDKYNRKIISLFRKDFWKDFC